MISGRVVGEGGKPPSVLQFIWSFIKEGEREIYICRNPRREAKRECVCVWERHQRAEQKESRDFMRKKMFVWNQYVFPSLSHPLRHSARTYPTAFSLSHTRSGFVFLWNPLKYLCVHKCEHTPNKEPYNTWRERSLKTSRLSRWSLLGWRKICNFRIFVFRWANQLRHKCHVTYHFGGAGPSWQLIGWWHQKNVHKSLAILSL